jgi:hypothetical protein
MKEKSRLIQYSCLAAWLIVSNSASVVDVVIVFCLRDFYLIGPPNRQKMNPSELFRLWLSAKLASKAVVKIEALISLSKQRERCFV